jgi:hypothetical protein
MFRPSIKLNSDSELLCLTIESTEMRLEVGDLAGTHPENPFRLDNLPMLAGNMATAPGHPEFISFGKYNHSGNGSGDIMKMNILRRWFHLELIEQRIHICSIYPSIVMHFSPTEQKRKKKPQSL